MKSKDEIIFEVEIPITITFLEVLHGYVCVWKLEQIGVEAVTSCSLFSTILQNSISSFLSHNSSSFPPSLVLLHFYFYFFCSTLIVAQR